MKGFNNTILFLILICWIPFTQPVHKINATSDFSKLEEKLEALRVQYNVPTVHVAITRNKDFIWTRGLGNQKAPNTVFLIASNQKSYSFLLI